MRTGKGRVDRGAVCRMLRFGSAGAAAAVTIAVAMFDERYSPFPFALPVREVAFVNAALAAVAAALGTALSPGRRPVRVLGGVGWAVLSVSAYAAALWVAPQTHALFL